LAKNIVDVKALRTKKIKLARGHHGLQNWKIELLIYPQSE